MALVAVGGLLTLRSGAAEETSHHEVIVEGRSFRVPAGFTIERVASSPLVDRPIVADLDEEGRLYVADSAGVNDSVHRQLETRPHRIVRLEDGDGDGRYDRSTVFVDRIAFPEGALWHDGWLYVAAPPVIWRFADRDGDGVADEQEPWVDAKTLTGCANDLHGPYHGLDGRIWWCKGAFAEQTWDRVGRAPFVTRASHIFRRAVEGGEVEPILTGGMDNPVEVAFSETGEPFLTTTFFQHPSVGRRDGLIHVVHGGVWGKPHDVIDGHPRTGDLMPVLTHLGAAAPCGLACYRSTAFGAEFEGNLFATLFNLRKVTRHELVAEGSSFRTKDSDFVATEDRDFHPTDVLEDADGSLLILDTGGWYKICCPTSQLAKPDVLGAVYRVRREGAHPRLAHARGGALPWGEAGSQELAAMLDDRRPFVRERAIRELARRSEDSREALAVVVARGATARARRNALWALGRIGTPAALGAARVGLIDGDASVRQVAARVAALHRDAGAVAALVRRLDDASPFVRRAAAEALGRVGDAGAVAPLLAAAASAEDRQLEHAIAFAMIEIGAPDATRRGLEAEDARTRRLALWALDGIGGGALGPDTVARALEDLDATVREAGLAIVSRHPEWADELVESARGLLAAADLDARAEVVTTLLARLSSSDAVAELLAETALAATATPAARGIALEAMARSARDPVPRAWPEAIARVVGAETDELRRVALDCARRLRVASAEGAELRAALLRVARGAELERLDRLAALVGAPGGAPLGEPSLRDLVLGSLGAGATVAERLLAADVLARAPLDAATVSALVAALDHLGPLEARRLVPRLEGLEDRGVVVALLEALERSGPALGLDAETVGRALAKTPSDLRGRADAVVAALDAERRGSAERLDTLLAELPAGDARRGQAVFNGAKAACSGCHAIGYLGGRAGPDLTNIGQSRSRRDLLESIVFPNSSFVRSYEPITVVTRRGEVLSGVPREQSAEAVRIVVGPDREELVPRASILEVRAGTVSIMPSGLADQISRQELADLLEFLVTTRWR